MTKPKSTRRQQETRLAVQRFKRIMIHLRGQMDELLRPQGVTTAQLAVLREVGASPGSSGAHLARSCFVTPQTAQALLKSLENQGFIVRGKDEVNDRIVTAKITPAGERLLQTAEKTSLKLLEQTWNGISDSEVDSLNDVLTRCLENIDDAASSTR